MKRLLEKLAERMAMTAFSNVMSGRRAKWYTLNWVLSLLTRLVWYGLVLFAFLANIFYYVVVPLLVVCMFIQVCQMNDQLDRIEAAQNNKSDTAIVIEFIEDIRERSENSE